MGAQGFGLEILHKDAHCQARTGILHTNHGDVKLPMFMPVGTLMTVKYLSPEEVKACGSGVILANTYHVSLRPGADLVERWVEFRSSCIMMDLCSLILGDFKFGVWLRIKELQRKELHLSLI